MMSKPGDQVADRLRTIEAKIDELEYRIVPLLMRPIERRKYWKSTREIRRGILGEP